jgi:hypothetical protein
MSELGQKRKSPLTLLHVRCSSESGRCRVKCKRPLLADSVEKFPHSFDFNFPSFAAMKARISSAMSRRRNHCSLYSVTGKRPMP